MIRPNSNPSSGTKNCVKHRRKHIKIALLQIRTQFCNIFFVLHLRVVFITTVVKIGNTDVVSVMANWVIQYFICSLCGILKCPVNIGE